MQINNLERANELAAKRDRLVRIVAEDQQIWAATQTALRRGIRTTPLDPISAGLEEVRKHIAGKARGELARIDRDLKTLGVNTSGAAA